MKKIFCIFLLLLFFIPSARGEEEGKVKAFIKHISRDLTAGVYDFRQGEWQWQGPTIAGASAASSYLFYKIDDQPLGDSATPNILGDGSAWLTRVGTYFPVAWPIAFLTTGFFLKKGSPERTKALSVAEELVESLVFTYATTGALKLIFDRTRPTGGHYSFPSGHTAPNFAMAGTIAYHFPWYIGVPTLAAVSAIGFSRVDLNQHYASDVLAGAGIGLFFATSVYLNHLAIKTKGPETSSFMPLLQGNTYGVLWTHVL